jgi:hypothetical protein
MRSSMLFEFVNLNVTFSIAFVFASRFITFEIFNLLMNFLYMLFKKEAVPALPVANIANE